MLSRPCYAHYRGVRPLRRRFAKRAVESKDAARFQQAVVDAELSFPAAVKSFESTLGIEISEAKTPRLYREPVRTTVFNLRRRSNASGFFHGPVTNDRYARFRG
jgi:hypothetical protein